MRTAAAVLPDTGSVFAERNLAFDPPPDLDNANVGIVKTIRTYAQAVSDQTLLFYYSAGFICLDPVLSLFFYIFLFFFLSEYIIFYLYSIFMYYLRYFQFLSMISLL